MHKGPNSLPYGLLPLLLVVLLLFLGAAYMKRQGYYQGDRKNVVVRCRQGHLFTTIWIPFVSFKAIRLGSIRYQHCPVGNHWSFVDIVNPSELTTEQARFASEHHDTYLP
jgi:hypothetical protein